MHLQNIFRVFHDAEKTHFRNRRIAHVDSNVQFVLVQYRLPRNLGISSDLHLESDLSGIFAARVDYFAHIR